MNFNFVFVIIAIVLSVVSTAFSQTFCIQQVVCGSDRRTYLTPCALKEAAKRKPGLKVAHQGPC